jgi:hypothetical protein
VKHNGVDESNDLESAQRTEVGAERSDGINLTFKKDLDVSWGDSIEFYRDGDLLFKGNVTSFSKKDLGVNKNRTDIEAEDEVFHKLKQPIYNNTFGTPTQIAIDETEGSPSEAILNSMLQDELPSINREGIESIETNIKYTADGDKVYDIVRHLANTVYADFSSTINDSNEMVFNFYQQTARDSGVTLNDSDISIVSEYSEDWPEPVNDLLFVGGEKTEVMNSSSPFSPVSFTTLQPDSSPLEFTFDFPKPELRKTEIYINNASPSSKIEMRIQPDTEGSPIDVTNRNMDIIQQSMDLIENPQDYFDIQYRKGRWMGQERQMHGFLNAKDSPVEVGVDSGGTPVWKQYYPSHVVTRVKDPESIDEHNAVIQDKITNPDITNHDMARRLARSILNERSQPKKRMTVNSISDRSLDLKAGQIVDIDSNKLDVDGKFRIDRITERYEGDGKVTHRMRLVG